MDRAEHSLMDRAIAGDSAALEVLLIENAPALRNRIERRSPPSLRSSSEDMLQEAMTLAFRSIRAFQPVGPHSFFHWLCAIADNVVRNTIRARTALKRGEGRAPLSLAAESGRSSACLLGVLALDQTSPSGDLRQRELLGAVESALENLPAAHREALQLRFVHEMPIAEVAERMNRTETAVNKILARALEKLRELVREQTRSIVDFRPERESG